LEGCNHVYEHYGTVVVENLNILGMGRDQHVTRSIDDQGWYKRISKNSSILPDLVRINFIHERAMEQHGKPSDESVKEKYRQYFVNNPLKFMKDAI